MLKPGICTQCGATLSMDSEQDCMICPYCKTPFIIEKAIGKFGNTYHVENHITAENVYVSSDSNKNFEIVGGVLIKYKGAAVDVEIPNTVLRIGEAAFAETMVRYIKVPEGVKELADRAFAGCSYLKELHLPDSLEWVGDDALDCPALETLYITETIVGDVILELSGTQLRNVYIDQVRMESSNPLCEMLLGTPLYWEYISLKEEAESEEEPGTPEEKERKDPWKKDFGTYLTCQGMSILGTVAVQYSITMWILANSKSSLVMSLASTSIVAFLPCMLAWPCVGFLIDHYGGRKVMIWGDRLVIFSSVVGLINYLISLEFYRPPIILMYIVLFLRGFGTAVHGPAMMADIPGLVPKDKLANASGWGVLVNTVSHVLGFTLGMLLSAHFVVRTIVIMDIVRALLSIGSLRFFSHLNIFYPKEKLTVGAGVKQGLRTIGNDLTLVAMFIAILLVNTFYTPWGYWFPLFMRTRVVWPSWNNSLVIVLALVGGICAPLAVGIWGRKKEQGSTVFRSIVMLGILELVYHYCTYSKIDIHGYIILGVWFLTHYFGTQMNIAFISYVFETIPQNMLGKVFSIFMGAMALTLPFAVWMSISLPDAIGVIPLYIWSRVGIIAAGILCYILRYRASLSGLLH